MESAQDKLLLEILRKLHRSGLNFSIIIKIKMTNRVNIIKMIKWNDIFTKKLSKSIISLSANGSKMTNTYDNDVFKIYSQSTFQYLQS